MSRYDTCWLPSEPLPGRHTFFLDPAATGPVVEGIRRELKTSLAAVEAGEANASLILRLARNLSPEGFAIHWESKACIIDAGGETGLLYGLYAVIRRLSLDGAPPSGSCYEAPACDIRMLDHWDMLSGEIERGYAGKSIFYDQGTFLNDFRRIEDYARILASIGINAVSLNNVNVKPEHISLMLPDGLRAARAYCDIFRRYGIRSFLSVNFASPMIAGGLASADPLREDVRAWWREAAARVCDALPGFGGFLIKADSEGEPGPHTYGRTHAEGANMLADALAPHGGLVIWRCFVYNYMQDWRDRTTDRAKAAWETFAPLDGQFRNNAVLQVKFGPLDFQIREPVSPLIGALRRTNLVVELQITQEYTGQQRHICYLAPQWKEVLNFDTYAQDRESTVARLIAGKQRHGLAAVASTGRDYNWTGHKLAQANLYAFGRLAWNPSLTAADILTEWIAQTFALPPALDARLFDMMLHSRDVYEAYTVPLGVCFMCRPESHYGPSVDGYEYDRWGTYHFADRDGVGNDRTALTGTGFTAQYHEPNRSAYENIGTCPDALLLFFHHVPYTHRLHSGKTVIQHIYDSHFDGVESVERYVRHWEAFSGSMPDADFENVRARLQEQLRCAKEWRDQINTYFYRKSGIGDERGRTIYP